MTIQINGKGLLFAGLAVVLIAGACYIAFLVGQGTRITEADATARTRTEVARAVDRAVAAEVKKADARVLATKRADAKRLDERVHRLNNMWRGRLRRAKDEAREEGYASGQSAGFSAGHSSGVEEGREQGLEEGIDEGIERGSDELTCSDDLDVPLPACSY